ncbi:MAG TPA: glycosyltransferase family 4 protein [Noviherbaspirillum sp.]
MKQVWILNHYAIEPGSAGITRHFDLAVNLRKHGWQATVIAASVEHITGRQRLEPHEKRRCESYSHVPFLWVRTPEYRGNGMRRVLNMLTYTWRVVMPGCTAGLSKPDVVIGSSVHPLAAVAALLLARRHRVPFVFEVRDLWPQTLVDFGKLSERSPVTWALRRLERWLYRSAVRIVAPLPYAADYISALGISRDKVVWIPNGVDLSATSTSSESVDASARNEVQSKPESPFVLMYFGAHGLANGLSPLIHAMKLVAGEAGSEAIKLRMIGSGALKEELQRLANTLNLTNISFEPPVPKSTIPQLAAQADGFVITVLGLPQLYRYGISMNKLFDYFAAARPVVIACNAANNPVLEAGAGITVPPDDPQELARAIIALYRMPPEERQRMGAAGRRYVEENHDTNRLAARLASTLNACSISTPTRETVRSLRS